MNLSLPTLRILATRGVFIALAGMSLSSCIVRRRPPPPPPVVVAPDEVAPVAALPRGAHVVVIHGERVWVRRGVYYRRHPRGYVVFRP